jgi:hypothetical protein
LPFFRHIIKNRKKKKIKKKIKHAKKKTLLTLRKTPRRVGRELLEIESRMAMPQIAVLTS